MRGVIFSTAGSKSAPAAAGGRLTALGQAVAMALAVFALGFFSLALTRRPGGPPALWSANAFALVCLIRTPPRRWPALLLATGLGLAAASMILTPLVLVLRATVSDIFEIAICAIGLRRLCGRRLDLSRPRMLVAFGCIALTAPALSDGLMVVTTPLSGGPISISRLIIWYCAHALGILVFTPVLLALRPRTVRRILAEPIDVALLAGFTVALFVLPNQSLFPPHATILALMVLITFRMEQTGAAIAALLMTVVAIGVMLAGPSRSGSDLAHALLVQQIGLVISAGCALAVGATLAHRRRLRVALKMSLTAAEAAHATSMAAMRRLELADQAVRSSEARYRLLADHSSDIIVRVDLKETLLYASPSCRSMGYKPEELIGVSWAELVHPDEADALKANRDALAQGLDAGSWVHRFRSKDGRWVWLEGTPSIVRNAAGAPIEFISQLRDVTERMAFEADLVAARDAAECAARAKSEFLANMSHEIRTPLTSIMGFSSLLGEYDAALPDQARRYVRHISTAGQGLLSVVNDILDFSKLEAGQLELDPQPFNPAAFIEDTVELLSTQAEKKGLTLGLIINDSVPDRIDADSSRLRQILLNLVGNAIKFTGAGRISVTVSHAGGATGQLRVQVADTGPGIPAEQRDRLFQRFSQVDGSVSRRHGGTGLGLAICKNLTALMGGEIGVESEEDKGSVFWFTVAAPSVDARAAAIAEDAPAFERRACRILVVDDVDVNRELVRAMLEPLGHSFVEARDGPEALAAAGREAFDLILMDLQMPGMDGMAATRAIRAGDSANRTTPIIALSADVLPEHLAACAAAGIDDHIGKPIQPMRLLTKVAEWAHEGRASDAEDRLLA